MLAVGILFFQVAVATPAAASDRVLDAAINMWRIENAVPFSKPPLAIFSPDGNRIGIVVSRGRLAENVTESELRVYPVSITRLAGHSAEEVLLRRTAAGNTPAIEAPRWLGKANAIAFIGMPQGSMFDDARQVYVLDLKTGNVAQRTHSSTTILGYGISDDGQNIVYAAKVAIDSAARDNQRLHGVVAAPEELGWMFDANTRYGFDIDYYVQQANSPARRVYRSTNAKVSRPVPYFESAGFVEVSPDGRSAIIGMHMLPSTPPRWLAYPASAVKEFVVHRAQAPPTYGLIDIPSGKVSLLVDAPSTWGGSTAQWSPDGKHVFVMGYVPLDSANPASLAVAKSEGGVVDVDFAARTAKLVANGQWRISHVSERGDTVMLARDGYTAARDDGGGTIRRVSTRTAVLSGSEWRTADSVELSTGLFHPAAAIAAGARVVAGIKESLDSAPELMILDRATQKSKVLTDLNPQLRAIPRGAIRKVSWAGPRAETWEGQLVTPVGYSPGKRYPAVIMVMDMNYNDEFVLDGKFYGSAYPVQALANRGFAVLMAYFPPIFYKHYVDSLERPIILSGMDGAFEYLVDQGIADSTRIAMTGFSHSGYVTQYSISKSKHRYAAAIALDNYDASYLSYMAFRNNASMKWQDDFYGGSPFGPAIQTWVREAPGFTLAEVRTPLYMETHNSHSVGEQGTNIGGWETFAGLRSLGKPVELVRYPYAEHILRRPSERNSSAQRQVDWLAFWINNEVDPSPAKREQYARWQAMKSEKPLAIGK